MPLIETKKALRSALSNRAPGSLLGLVPTMGALHDGHLALVRKAVSENDVVVVSIFVNPTQFNNAGDLESYPRDHETDLALLNSVSEQLLVFVPPVAEMYQEGLHAKTYDFGGLEKVMEGAFRPGHFNGVGTVVEMLLRAVAPQRAYFGEKDFQQLQIIKSLVAQLELPITIVGCPIVREADGLALSSRNKRLSEGVRKEAPFIHATLKAVKTQFGTKNASSIEEWVKESFEKHPHLELEYLTIANERTLLPDAKIQDDQKYRAFIAVYADDVRLIDNIALN